MLRNSRTIHVLLAVVAFLLGANLLVSLHQDRLARAAQIFDPNAGLAQAQVDQLTELNKKVDRLQSFLESGKLAVKVSEMPKADAAK
jgi:hypothetical protein